MKVLAYTLSHLGRRHLRKLVPAMRGAAGMWFDWHVFLGAPSKESREDAELLLNDPQHLGIQFLTTWPENRGQHHMTRAVLKQAREQDYQWILRIDDDLTPKTKEFLAKMLSRLSELKERAKDPVYRIIATAKVIGLQHPIRATASISLGQNFPVDVIEKAGGTCRLTPVALLEDYVPDIYDPVGRGDPESFAVHAARTNGMVVRFPDIRVVHQTAELERQDSDTLKKVRAMSKIWPWLETEIL